MAERTESFNPATGEAIGSSPLDSRDDVRRLIEQARAVQPEWARQPPRRRSRLLLRVRDYVVEHVDELAATISQDNGKTRLEALSTEVLACALACDYYARQAPRFLRDQRLGASTWMLANKRSTLRRVPYGVVAVISPWNYPFSIPFHEVVMALLAGNAVVLKVASQTQMVGRALERCVAAAGLPEGVFTYVNMPGSSAGETLLGCGVDKLFFTGSVEVGKQLMALASETLTPVSLELGGNDAMLVCADADLDRAAAGAVWAGMQNCGQSCGGVERIFVHRDVYDQLLDKLVVRVEALRMGEGSSHEVDLGAMTTRRQLETVQRHVEDALAKGARIAARSACPSETGGTFYPATVLVDVDTSMDVMTEETFGPVVAVQPVASMDEAVALTNDSTLGLTASVWSRDRRRAARLGGQIQAGVITLNDHLMSHGLPETPWGGFKQSGIGRTHGRIGFDEMTQPQCVVDDLLSWTRKDLWWHPSSGEVYEGLKGVLDMLYAPGWGRRLRGLRKTLALLPRVLRP